MNQVRIIKRRDESKQPEVDRSEQSHQFSTRDTAVTIKQWVSEFKRRRRDQGLGLNRGLAIIQTEFNGEFRPLIG